MDDSSPPVPAQPARSRRRRLLAWLAAVLLLLAVLLGSLVGGLYWAAGTPGGTAWLLTTLARSGIGISATDPQGSLVGDFHAKQVVISIGDVRIIVDAPTWRGLVVGYARFPRTWATLHVDDFKADRVTLTLPPTSGEPFKLPSHLQLPLALQIDQLQVAEVMLPWLAPHPLRDVRAQLHLGADDGTQHRIDAVSLRLDPLQISGRLHIGTRAPMALELDLQAAQSTALGAQAAGPVLPPWAKALRTDWQAELQARGPLERFGLQALLRSKGQQLDATAQVALNERWPLPRLALRTQSLDLSALFASAPLTALSGSVTIAATPGADSASALTAQGEIVNARPGRWDQQQAPLRRLGFELHARTDQSSQLELSRFEAQFAGAKDAGKVQGKGHWNADSFDLSATLDQLQPVALDLRLPAMTLSGPITLTGQTAPRAADGSLQLPSFKALAELNGRLTDFSQAVQMRLQASGDAEHVELQGFRAVAGNAEATLTGRADHDASGWRVRTKAALVNFDPRHWFPGPSTSAWQIGPHRFNLTSDADLTLPDVAPNDKRRWLDRLPSVRGDASAQIAESLLAGVPTTGELTLHHVSAAEPLRVVADLDLGGNQVKLEGRLATDAQGTDDRWTLTAQAPALARLAPVLRLWPSAQASGLLDGLTGALSTEAQVSGRWPALSSQGSAQLSALRAGPLTAEQADLRWQFGSTSEAPLDVLATINQLGWGSQQLGMTTLQLKGSTGAHEFTLRSELKAAPPAWVDALQTRAGSVGPVRPRTQIQASARGTLEGGFLDRGKTPPPLLWKGTLQQLDVRSGLPGEAPLLVTKDLSIELQAGDLPRVALSAGRADVLGAGLRWNRIDWQAGQGLQTQQLDMQAELEPLAVAPLLRRLQPSFGWGGDLLVGGKVVIQQTTQFSADIVFERVSGDLNVTDETGTQALGLSDLRVGLDAKDGVWNFTSGLAGSQLGVAAGALVVTTTPDRAWPEPTAPVQGVFEAQVANLGTWGTWVPAGWRLGGQLRASASIGGRFNAIEYTGDMKGSDIAVRNLLLGVNLTQGEVDINLQGDTARINKLGARAGSGSVRMEGDARLGEVPQANLQLTADKFQVLGRIDRRLIISGQAAVVLDKEKLNVDGDFRVDEGLIDFSRANAPSLAGDVVVTGRGVVEEEPAPATPSSRVTTVNLQVNLGEQLKLRGRGLDTRLRGELKLTTPGGKVALNGTVSAADGTYNAYGQKLTIDRGEVIFTGALDNPRVDIEATRPNLDVRVGVAITGPLMSLRVRLFSEPEMSNTDKLSWLMLGRPSDGLGRSDAALLQSAALALLAGEGEGVTDQITRAIGLDEVSLSQNTTANDTRETIVSVGKQLSQRVFLSYEQNLNTSAGSVQLSYRIAQRFLARVQSGLEDRSLDLIWTWRWE